MNSYERHVIHTALQNFEGVHQLHWYRAQLPRGRLPREAEQAGGHRPKSRGVELGRSGGKRWGDF